MRIRLTAMLTLALGLGCAPSVVPVTQPTPSPSNPPVDPCPSTPPPSYAPITTSAEHLDGDWVGLSQDPIAAGWPPITTCDRKPFVLRLRQTSHVLEGEVVRTDGYVYLFDMALRGPGRVSGEIRDGRIVLNGQADDAFASPAPGLVSVRYDLRYDATTQHMHGTLNERPIWLLPVVTQAPCPSPRPCDPVI